MLNSFGRESEIEIIEANLVASRLPVLYGASGVGKSSVLRAGVVHRLLKIMEENIRDQGTQEFVDVVFNSWRDEPTTSLISYINDAVAKTYKAQSFQMIEEQSSLTEILQAWTQRLNIDF